MDARSEDEKLEAARQMQEHIEKARLEREVYSDCIKMSRDTYGTDAQYVHYTFDFSQNVSLPHHSRQIGPLYFVSGRKIQIFGFRIDGIPKQLKILIDEADTIGPDGSLVHGPNAVISMVDCALESHNQNDVNCTIHVDNCAGN